jgi:hypothetical protein
MAGVFLSYRSTQRFWIESFRKTSLVDDQLVAKGSGKIFDYGIDLTTQGLYREDSDGSIKNSSVFIAVIDEKYPISKETTREFEIAYSQFFRNGRPVPHKAFGLIFVDQKGLDWFNEIRGDSRRPFPDDFTYLKMFDHTGAPLYPYDGNLPNDRVIKELQAFLRRIRYELHSEELHTEEVHTDKLQPDAKRRDQEPQKSAPLPRVGHHIFISYAREDRTRAQTLAQTLEDRGWSTFWDRRIPAGKTWRDTIGRELSDARCVIVLWSKTSIKSDWVHDEADDAKRRGILIPVLIEDVDPPFGFRSIQAADLIDWQAMELTEAFRSLIADISDLIGPPS